MYSPALLPSRLRAAPAKKRRLSAENGISSREAMSGLPTVTDSSRARPSAGSASTARGPSARRVSPPLGRRGLGRLGRAVDVLSATAWHLGDRLAGRGRDHPHSL